MNRIVLLAVAIVATSLYSACNSPLFNSAAQPPPLQHTHSLQEAHTRAMQQRWGQRPYRELEAEWGPPRIILTIPPGEDLSSEAYVYGQDEDSGCLDTFLVRHPGSEQATVETYYCR